jgi:hypothetical protein
MTAVPAEMPNTPAETGKIPNHSPLPVSPRADLTVIELIAT